MFFPGTPNISVPGDNVFMLFKCMCNNKLIKKKKETKLPPGKLPSMKFFCEFFRISNFIFMRILVRKKNLFSFNSFFVINNNLLILYFSIIFSRAYIFDFQASHTMFIIHICVSNNAGHRYLASDVNCRKASLTLWVNHNRSIQI